MARSVIGKSMWDRRISLIWWLLGIVLLTAWIVAFYPVLRDSPDLTDFIDTFPPEALALLGIDPATYQTGFGYLQAQLYGFLAPLLILGFTVVSAAGATATEEESGTIDLVLATPTSRTRLILEKAAAITSQTTALVLAMVVVLVVANPVVDLRLSLKGIIGINAGVLALGLFFGALTMVVAAWRGSRATAAGVGLGVGLIAFFINGFAPLVEELTGLQKVMPFFWYLDGDPLLAGPTMLHLVLVVGAALLMGGAVVTFRGADLGARRPLFDLLGRRLGRGPDDRRTATGRVPHSVYAKMLWDRRKSLWWWLLGIGGIAAITIAFWPTIESGGDAMQGMLEAIPKEFLAMFGITDVATLLTPEGFLSARLYSTIGTTLMLILAIGAGTRAIAGEEATGTLDLLFGLPIRRWRVVGDWAAGLATMLFLVMAGLTLIVIAGQAAVSMGLDAVNITAANIGLGLLALFFGTMALAIGGWGGNAGLATGGAAAAAVAAFLLNGLGAAIDGLEPFRVISPFFWYLQDSPPLARGLTASYWLLVIGSGVFVAVAVTGFGRRDLAV